MCHMLKAPRLYSFDIDRSSKAAAGPAAWGVEVKRNAVRLLVKESDAMRAWTLLVLILADSLVT